LLLPLHQTQHHELKDAPIAGVQAAGDHATVPGAAGNGANHADTGLGLLHINAKEDAQATTSTTIGAPLSSTRPSASCWVGRLHQAAAFVLLAFNLFDNMYKGELRVR
jgi:hypothetical protein